jgi:thiol-disulfide isomerase/thioredoxin
VALQQRDEAHAALKELFRNYISSQPNSTARYFALGMARQFLPPSDWAAQLQLADSLFPNHPGITLLKVNAASTTVQGSHLLNKPVPELTLPDSTGKLVSVSAFRGRWLLIDCWASWCAPCRKENPNILAAWRKYNKKGFSVLGVSLDKDRAAWLNAIKSDSLQWQHVSDLKYWDSRAVSTFDIQSLPFNLLVDPKGEVKAINLTDSLLDKTLGTFIK